MLLLAYGGTVVLPTVTAYLLLAYRLESGLADVHERLPGQEPGGPDRVEGWARSSLQGIEGEELTGSFRAGGQEEAFPPRELQLESSPADEEGRPGLPVVEGRERSGEWGAGEGDAAPAGPDPRTEQNQ